MNRKPFASFDLEIATDLTSDDKSIDKWQEYAPLGISCAALKLEDVDNVIFWEGKPRMSKADCVGMMKSLRLIMDNYDIITWNGTSFDFRVLAIETGFVPECGYIALKSIDMMLEVVFRKGHYLGLDTALSGMNIGSKLHEVRLNSGRLLNDMSGDMAPLLWAAGEYGAVLEYLKYDVIRPLELAKKIADCYFLAWQSKRGFPSCVDIDRLVPAYQLFSLPPPDTSWMSYPPKRKQFFDWIPNYTSFLPSDQQPIF